MMGNQQSRIYVVDDDLAAREALSALLREHHYDVVASDSAESFLQVFEQDVPSCILLDIQMGGISGLELQEHLIDQNIFTPIIFITGHGTISWSVKAIRQGAEDFLEKPYDALTLIQTITQALDQDKLTRNIYFNCSDVAKRYASLSRREKQVVDMLAYSSSNSTAKQIAKELDISHRTVEGYRLEALKKMGVSSIKELITRMIVCKLRSV